MAEFGIRLVSPRQLLIEQSKYLRFLVDKAGVAEFGIRRLPFEQVASPRRTRVRTRFFRESRPRRQQPFLITLTKAKFPHPASIIFIGLFSCKQELVHIMNKINFRPNKGYVYTLETMLATATIFAALILIFATVPEEAEINLAVIKQTGYDALFYMDQNDELRKAVSKGSLSAINSNLSKILPPSVNFDTSICTISCNSTKIPENRTIVTVDYYIGGYREIYINRKVRLWMWEKF